VVGTVTPVFSERVEGQEPERRTEPWVSMNPLESSQSRVRFRTRCSYGLRDLATFAPLERNL